MGDSVRLILNFNIPHIFARHNFIFIFYIQVLLFLVKVYFYKNYF